MSSTLGFPNDVLKYDGSTKVIPVAGEVTVYTRVFNLYWAQKFGIWCLASSALGTPNLKIELELANRLPETEGSAETTLYGVQEGSTPIFAAIADKVAHRDATEPSPSKYGRYKITGLTGNPADTTILIENFLQEMI